MSGSGEVAVFIGEALARYGFGQGHPFGPDRMDAFWNEARRRGLDRRVTVGAPESAAEEDLRRFHTAEYVERVRAQSRSGFGFLDAGDTPAFRGVFEAASCVVGTTLAALSALIEGRCRAAFVPIAGLHHARRDAAAGFCVFNDCGVAIELLRAVHGVHRVAYVDIDAHHGDGVFYAFEEDPDVVIADLHEDGRYLYPGTGAASETGRGAARGTKLNLPLAPGADDAAFAAAWRRAEAFVRAARPEFVIFQCGADGLAGDPITHLAYTPAAHARAARDLAALARECGARGVLGLGGGGYDRANLAAAWCAVLEAWIGG